MKDFGIKDVKAIANVFPHDSDAGKKLAIGEGYWTVLRLSLVKILAVLDETNGKEMSPMCASTNMAIYVIEIIMLRVDTNLVII